jgi:YVTN family beta-propeller protein
MKYAVYYISIISLVLALALSSTFLGLEKAWADSVIATITVGTGPYDAIFNPITGHVYTADIASSTVSVIDTASNSVLTTIHLPNNYTPRELALDTKRNYIYTANIFSNTLSVIDAATNNVIDTIQSSGSIVDGVTYDPVNDQVYAVNAGSGTVSVIDGATRAVVDTITVGGDPLQGVFDPDNGLTYIPHTSDSISVINGASRTVVDTVLNVPNPVYLTYDSANGNIYAANHDTQVVSVIDTSTNNVINTITVGPDPTCVGFDPDNGIIYVGNQGANYVSLINGLNNQVIGTVTVGSGPVTPVYDPVHHNVYVINYHSNEAPGNTVSVISTSTTPVPPNTVITSSIDGNNNPVLNGGSTVSTSITFQISATPGTNPVAGFECSLDDSAFSTCATTNPGTVSYDNLAAGQQHTFEVRAADTQGNKDPTPATFTWTIITPQQEIQNLINTIRHMHLSRDITTSLEGPLNNAINQLNRNNNAAACNTLNAFLHQADAKEANRQLTSAQAAELRQQATAIETSLGCSSTSSSSLSEIALPH